jgi:hypothetical protein
MGADHTNFELESVFHWRAQNSQLESLFDLALGAKRFEFRLCTKAQVATSLDNDSHSHSHSGGPKWESFAFDPKSDKKVLISQIGLKGQKGLNIFNT